jgi:hypothetical protein
MRRLVALAVVLTVIGAGCGGDDAEHDASPATTTATVPPHTTTTATTLPVENVRTTDECPGLGAAPTDPMVTWIADDHLWQAPVDDTSNPTCLLRTSYPFIEWGGEADRMLIGDVVVVGSDVHDLGGDEARHLHALSRPSGRAVLASTTDGETVKVPLDGSDEILLPSIHESTDARYHPSGLAIVSAQPRGERPGLLLLDNLGVEARWLVDNETAHELRDLTFDASGHLYFVARHDDGDHVHRYDFETNVLSIVLATSGDEHINSVVTSPFDDGDVAISRSKEQQLTDLWVQRNGEQVDVSGTDVEHGDPIGWLPDGDLLVGVYEQDVHCCDVPPFDLYVLGTDGAHLLERDVDAAAVRAPLPPAPPAPPRIDEAAPA